MVSQSVVIGVGILVLVGLGFLFMTTMSPWDDLGSPTGNVITGSIADSEVVEGEDFGVDGFGSPARDDSGEPNELNEEVEDDGKNNSGSR